jgi:hypothetical protein
VRGYAAPFFLGFGPRLISLRLRHSASRASTSAFGTATIAAMTFSTSARLRGLGLAINPRFQVFPLTDPPIKLDCPLARLGQGHKSFFPGFPKHGEGPTRYLLYCVEAARDGVYSILHAASVSAACAPRQDICLYFVARRHLWPD